MRFALIDNSTLTGIQRLLGQIPVKNTLAIDMDILCLESLIEAILFYDVIAAIDDYKPNYRENRKTAFPNLIWLEPDHIHYDKLLANTKNITENIVPQVEAGQFTDSDFKPFFDLLKMNVIFTWDMSSSIYYLTQKMLAGVGGLDLEKYSKLNTAIHFELIDKKRSDSTESVEDKLILVDSKHHRLETEGYRVVDEDALSKDLVGLSGQASSFFAGLNWLAFRTIFYTIASNSLGADLFLHPIRHAFQVNFLAKLNGNDLAIYKPLIEAMNDITNETINTIFSNTHSIITKHPIPLFVTWFTQKVGDPRRYLDVAYDIRQDSPFIEARRRLIELEEILNEDNPRFLTEANRLIREVENSLKAITAKYQAATNQGLSSTSLIKLWNLSTIVTKLPNIPDFNFQIPQFAAIKDARPKKGFTGIYRNIISDLTEVSHLGEYHEIAASQVWFDKEAMAYMEKTEDIKYRGRIFHWKIPM